MKKIIQYIGIGMVMASCHADTIENEAELKIVREVFPIGEVYNSPNFSSEYIVTINDTIMYQVRLSEITNKVHDIQLMEHK